MSGRVPPSPRTPTSYGLVHVQGLVYRCRECGAAFYTAATFDQLESCPACGVPDDRAETEFAAWLAPESSQADPAGRCRVCGCTDDNCAECWEELDGPCTWIEPDLCSRCSGPVAWVVLAVPPELLTDALAWEIRNELRRLELPMLLEPWLWVPHQDRHRWPEPQVQHGSSRRSTYWYPDGTDGEAACVGPIPVELGDEIAEALGTDWKEAYSRARDVALEVLRCALQRAR